jgi:PTH1 family peptidyl-tRNA hydrolase
MHIIFGLGNPGRKYGATRHNVGFETIDLLAKRNNIEVKQLKFKALYGEGYIGEKKVMLAKPQTFMNLSGQSLLDIGAVYRKGYKGF